ncbi:MAG: 16S rRNA (cytosine(1402)-N(4))-methyltransferase RsmH [Leptospira sp.]|nr:16S rRNA (cytosine(1402)-N(4))-methyltransferase RsmH [Leptospira sp.]
MDNIDFIPVHIPVLSREILTFFGELSDAGNLQFLDGTAGEGGHSEMILNAFPGSKVVLFDRDDEMIERSKKRLEKFSERVLFENRNFSEIDSGLLRESRLPETFDGILLDLGISTYHLTGSERGFSFKRDEVLDMRLDSSSNLTALEIIKRYNTENLHRIFREYGEENWAKKIAERLVDSRKKNPIRTTGELAKFVESVIPRKFWPPKTHPAIRVFQALRIEVNQELVHIEKGISKLAGLLNENGILCIISFHSLEDRIVKNQMKDLVKGGGFVLLTKKPVIPGDEEISQNGASRSAKLRAIQRKE